MGEKSFGIDTYSYVKKLKLDKMTSRFKCGGVQNVTRLNFFFQNKLLPH